ncbi:hypothetical protein HPP92_028130 [Vanilla planifolia]|uniref:Uncharacterized protein n=1 Tax=Vanilla planifolia TaxID=51239 RepID=A0A835P8M7_VANPL|nr:hypothetical protein HPP92_028130 [Vanilla planifolia]KAG0447885.1 hypothetical protein HPP92_028110 [Vanilla planifolia]
MFRSWVSFTKCFRVNFTSRKPISDRRLPYLSMFQAGVLLDSHYQKRSRSRFAPPLMPDYMVDASSVKYWGPPTTGVFGPADLLEILRWLRKGIRHS